MAAVYAASALCHKNSNCIESVPPCHPVSGTLSHLLATALSDHPSIRIMISFAKVIEITPFQAMVATSRESWVFSKRLANDAASAADEFLRLKNELRSWPGESSGMSIVAGTGNAASKPRGSCTRAVSLAIQLLKEACATPHLQLLLDCGPELALVSLH